jgi:hypothetical protein
MVLSMLFAMILLVGVVIDTGQAINRRIALQVVADAGAYTGASVMAAGMNQMAYINRLIQYSWIGLNLAAGGLRVWPIPPFCLCKYEIADVAVSTYQVARAALGALYGVTATGFQNGSVAEARRVSEYNMKELLPGEWQRCDYRQMDFSPEAGVITSPTWWPPFLSRPNQVDDGDRLPERYWDVFRELFPARTSPTWCCYKTYGACPACVELPTPMSASFDVWYRKDPDEGVRYFVWEVVAPRARALMFDEMFGGRIIPEMKAVAVAKPIGGEIENADNTYVAKMLPTSTAMQSGGVIWDSNYRRILRYVTH